MSKVVFFFLLLFRLLAVKAQDVHFSQFDMAPESPALSGNLNSEFQAGAIHRRQWFSVPVNYRDLLVYFDKKILTPVAGNGLAYGIRIGQGAAGDGGLRHTQIQFNGAVSRQFSPALKASAGFGVTYHLRQFNPEKLSFGSQFSDIYHPDAPSGEKFDRTTTSFVGLSTGIDVLIRRGALLEGHVGIASAQFNRPKTNFLSEDISLFPRIAVYTFGNVYLSETGDLLFKVQYQSQEAYRETVLSTGIKYYLNRSVNDPTAVAFSTGIRLGDAIIPEVRFFRGPWSGGLSYDINISPFKVATHRRGGPEISVRYVAPAVLPPKKNTNCVL